MFVVRTSSHLYQTRLTHLLDTWISFVSDDVFFITDRALPNISLSHQLLTELTCGPDAHSMTILCCKTAHDFQLFREFRRHYQWFCHFDDDQYVHVENLQTYLSTLDSQQPYYIGRNSWPSALHRSKEPYPHPFWFATLGAGICFSENLLDRLASSTRIRVREFINGCLEENYPDDIYLGFLLAAYFNVSLTRNERFHSHLEKEFHRDFRNQLTFGFRFPDRLPEFLPALFNSTEDPLRIRTLHCLLYPDLVDCRSEK